MYDTTLLPLKSYVIPKRVGLFVQEALWITFLTSASYSSVRVLHSGCMSSDDVALRSAQRFDELIISAYFISLASSAQFTWLFHP